jgi:NADH-quinone oxidoreductase subunit E
MTETASRDCRRNSWLVALGGGALVALMLLLVAQYAVLKAIFIGLVFTVLLGIFLVWAFCSQGTAAAAPHPLPEARPAPEPVEPPAPAATPPAFVTAQPAARPAAAPVAPAPDSAGDKPAPAKRARKPASAAGLDAALARSRAEPPAAAPEMLAAPRGGRADDLKVIRGIGPKLETLLNGVGVWHFDQIASWKAKDIAHVDEKLVGFRGRITRDEWVKQARALAAGGRTDAAGRAGKVKPDRGEE